MRIPKWVDDRVKAIQDGGSPDDLPLEERQWMVLWLSVGEGWTYNDIADLIQRSVSRVFQIIQKGKRDYGKLIFQEDAREMLASLLIREEALYKKALAKNEYMTCQRINEGIFTMLQKTGVLPTELETLPEGRDELMQLYQRLAKEIDQELQRGAPVGLPAATEETPEPSEEEGAQPALPSIPDDLIDDDLTKAEDR